MTTHACEFASGVLRSMVRFLFEWRLQGETRVRVGSCHRASVLARTGIRLPSK